jgi:hypothetical protein
MELSIITLITVECKQAFHRLGAQGIYTWQYQHQTSLKTKDQLFINCSTGPKKLLCYAICLLQNGRHCPPSLLHTCFTLSPSTPADR